MCFVLFVCLFVCLCLLVPVFFGDAIERVKKNGHHDSRVLLEEMKNVLVVPVIQRPLSYLYGTVQCV